MESIFASSELTQLPVTVDKSHLVAIGERLYAESVELLRELVNNAYDADATVVHIQLSEHEITVSDNGSGMDLEGLKQYFEIGSTQKKRTPKSPRFGRDRIGEFGIGKFSTLSASDHFEVSTQRGGFTATVIFDRQDWEATREHWYLPLRIGAPDPSSGDGTRVTLRGLKKTFDLDVVERHLLETLPLQAKNFSVLLNGKKLEPRYTEGRRIPFLEGTLFGVVHGELIIRPASRAEASEVGILVRIKQVAVARLPFDLQGPALGRIMGEVHADFLPITSDRSGFVRDSVEFAAFDEVMKKVLDRACRELAHLSDEHENRRVKRAMKELMDKIQKALAANVEWCPTGLLPVGEPGGHSMASIKKSATIPQESAKAEEAVSRAPKPQRPARKPRPTLKTLTPSAMITKLKVGPQGLALVMDHFGPDKPESFTEMDIIYINRDHPLYVREAHHRERHIMHVARLIAQEIALMSHPRHSREAFERQSKLLRDAFISEPSCEKP
jgi:hypothetical protein